MAAASYLPSSDRDRPPLWRRAAGIVLALVAELLLVAMLLTLAPEATRRLAETTATFRLLPEPRLAPVRTRTVARIKRPSGGASPRARTRPAVAAAAPPPSAPRSNAFANVVPLTRAELDAADIATMPTHPAATQAEAADAGGTGVGKGSGPDDGSGAGPNGERLYDADWYVRPTDAELSPYLRAGAPRTGWGEVACQTVEDHRVENCEQLGESPLGSGFARAVREAAWQFRVMPPRIGGRPMIGAWVRIRIDYTEHEVK